jgi:hypothetical protein
MINCRKEIIMNWYKKAQNQIRGFRAENSGRGIMTDAIQGGIYFFPKRETAELWAGEQGTIIEALISLDNASVQEESEGNASYRGEDVIIRKDPMGSGQIMEIIVFNKSKITLV